MEKLLLWAEIFFETEKNKMNAQSKMAGIKVLDKLQIFLQWTFFIWKIWGNFVFF
jgi:hypothetical protein